MFIIKIADLKIAIDNKYDFVKNICKDYIIESDEYLFTASVTEEEMKGERLASGTEYSDGFIESVCIYRAIAQQIPYYDAFVMHSAAIEYDGYAYCFAAKSGTGKTTHIKLWRKTIGEKIHVINGDKPIMRFINGKLYVCGTPWGGKENFNANTMAPIKGVCFLSQAKDNCIKRISSHEALGKILQQVFIPKDAAIAAITVDLIGKMLETTPMWALQCNISQEAALTSFNAMSKE